MLEQICKDLEMSENVRGNLIALRQEIKDEDTLAAWKAYHKEHAVLYTFLFDEDPKVRKNAALILGSTEGNAAVQALYDAYEVESTLFVRSAYIKAMEGLELGGCLGKLKQRLERLLEMQPEKEEQKHYHAEVHGLITLIRANEKPIKHRFVGYDVPLDILLTTMPGYQSATARQCIHDKPVVVPVGVKLHTAHLGELVHLRTFHELLITLDGNNHIKGTHEEIAEEILNTNLMSLLTTLHEGDGIFPFRMEVKGAISADKRNEILHRVAEQLEQKSGYRLFNTTGDYELEIRLIVNRDKSFCPILKLFTLPLHRFSYRKRSVAASIHPAVAALLMQLAEPYLKEGARVLDPFCGVGTMLIERDMMTPAGELYGTDIFGEAIEKGRENAQAAGEKINFINRNFFDFTHEQLFDEMVTNMPMRGKMEKEEHDQLYADFFARAGQLLKPGSIIVMYSNEEGFVKKQLRLHKEYVLKQENLIRQNDRSYLFVISYKG